MSQELENSFELGKLYFDRGDFDRSTLHLQQSADIAFKERNFTQYLNCQNFLLQIFAEKEEFNKINLTKEKLQDLVLKEGFELNSKTYYTLAICACYKSQNELALDYLQKALAIALAGDSKEDICQSIFGLALVYSRPEINRLGDALREIENLKIFFQVLKMPDLELASRMVHADILKQLKRYDEAIETAWLAYDSVQQIKNMTSITYLLFLLGTIFKDAGDVERSCMYLKLAQRSVDPKNYVRLSRMINKEIAETGEMSEQTYDMVFNEDKHSVTEKKLGKIDFKNQFILLDLLKLFIQNQGIVYSKEFLVENVWKQPYDPSAHDNKIYVTIKRLRKLIEPDFERPKYIFRAKDGYYMNKTARVLVETKH